MKNTNQLKPMARGGLTVRLPGGDENGLDLTLYSFHSRWMESAKNLGEIATAHQMGTALVVCGDMNDFVASEIFRGESGRHFNEKGSGEKHMGTPTSRAVGASWNIGISFSCIFPGNGVAARDDYPRQNGLANEGK